MLKLVCLAFLLSISQVFAQSYGSYSGSSSSGSYGMYGGYGSYYPNVLNKIKVRFNVYDSTAGFYSTGYPNGIGHVSMEASVRNGDIIKYVALDNGYTKHMSANLFIEAEKIDTIGATGIQLYSYYNYPIATGSCYSGYFCFLNLDLLELRKFKFGRYYHLTSPSAYDMYKVVISYSDGSQKYLYFYPRPTSHVGGYYGY